jgi:nicotinate-nucleotide adenylyltransferase
MVRAAVGGSTRFVVDAREIERPGPSYTIDTVLELKGEHRGAELFLIVGADILGELQRWHRVEEIARHACFAVMSRAELAVPSALPSGLEMLEVAVTAIAVSSSDIRDRVRMGRPYRYLVPEAVREIIDGNSLYRNPGSVRNDIEK